MNRLFDYLTFSEVEVQANKLQVNEKPRSDWLLVHAEHQLAWKVSASCTLMLVAGRETVLEKQRKVYHFALLSPASRLCRSSPTDLWYRVSTGLSSGRNIEGVSEFSRMSLREDTLSFYCNVLCELGAGRVHWTVGNEYAMGKGAGPPKRSFGRGYNITSCSWEANG